MVNYNTPRQSGQIFDIHRDSTSHDQNQAVTLSRPAVSYGVLSTDCKVHELKDKNFVEHVTVKLCCVVNYRCCCDCVGKKQTFVPVLHDIFHQ